MINKKCPKCGSRNFQIEDEYTTVYMYQVVNGEVEADGEDKDCGRHVSTTCYCNECGYGWHPKKMSFMLK